MQFFRKDIIKFATLFISFFIISLTFWITKTFGKNVYYVEILYNIHIGYEGFKNSPNTYKINFALYTIFPAIILSIISLVVGKKIENIFQYHHGQKNIWINKYIKFFKIFFF